MVVVMASNHTRVVGIALAALAVSTTATSVDAAPNRASAFRADKQFGLGIMLGAPSGLSGKYFLDSKHAIDFGVGAIGYYRGRDGLHLHLDYLIHPFSITNNPTFDLPLYFGIGGRLFNFDDNDNNDDRDGLALGVRAPLGVAFDFNRVPLDVFVELALVADIFVGYNDDFGIDVNGAVGIRYWFQ